MEEITYLLNSTVEGDRPASTDLLDAIYGELHRHASSYMRREQRADHTSQPTALNEAYLHLIGRHQVHWDSRGHFYSAAAQTTRHILIDRSRSHGGEQAPVVPVLIPVRLCL